MEWNDSIKVSKEDLASMDATNKNQLKTEKERVPVVAQDALMRLDCLKVKIECEKVHLELDRTESFLLRLSFFPGITYAKFRSAAWDDVHTEDKTSLIIYNNMKFELR